MSMTTFEHLESEVRGYCRSWPTIFDKASGPHLFGEDGSKYIDFFAGAGVLNYGHNEPHLKRALVDYLISDGVVHGLDMATSAKERFLLRFDEVVLQPRRMDYKIQFPGPTGTNSVEAALKLARKITGRELVIGFTNAFHGMTLGALAVTGNEMKRRGAGVPLHHSVSMPYENFFGDEVDTIDYLDGYLEANGSGVEAPAAIIVETVQCEGGLNVASFEWLKKLEQVCRRHGTLLILDDIQAGCGRTGPFFSFEPAGIEPDIICLSKSLSGYGQPMAITLIKRELDAWDPGEHNGTFRGNNAAFVTAVEALDRYWTNDALSDEVANKAETMHRALQGIADEFPEAKLTWRGRGMVQGLHSEVPDFPSAVSREAFERGVIMETSGPESEVLKLLPPLTIPQDVLDDGLCLVREAVAAAVEHHIKAGEASAEPVIA